MNPVFLFQSEEKFSEAFVHGLELLIDDVINQPRAGTFILALANATQLKSLYSHLKPKLQVAFNAIETEYSRIASEGSDYRDAADDVSVMLQIIKRVNAKGFDSIPVVEIFRSDNWELQYNELRSLRPQRMSAKTPATILPEFNAEQFNFNKPFLQKEIFWQGELFNRNVALFYNKFPFIDYHCLLVIEQQKCQPQVLTQSTHDYVTSLVQELNKRMQGITLSFNSIGAYASVNHLHFQLFVRKQGLPVEDSRWIHNKGNEMYPASCIRLDEAEQSWELISHLHQNNIPYNLIYTSDCLYCLPRVMQGQDTIPEWSAGFAWYEMSGGFVCNQRSDFEKLKQDQQQIEAALKSCSELVKV